MNEYKKTDLSKLIHILDIDENNFTPIFTKFDDLIKECNFQNSPEEIPFQNENESISIEQKSKETIKELDNNSFPKSVEIFENGSVQIKNNKYLDNKINDIIIPEFDNNKENIRINNNMLFISNSSNKKNKSVEIENLQNFSEFNLNEENEDKYNLQKIFLLYIERFRNNFFTIINKLIELKLGKKKKGIINKIYNKENINIINNNINNIYINNNFNIINEKNDFSKGKNKNYQNNIINANKDNLILDEYNNNDFKPLSQKYKSTDVSKILQNNEILNTEIFNKMLKAINEKIEHSSNVRLNLDSGYKTKIEQIFFTIPEEDNESYDSMSLKNSVRSSLKATPNLLEIKKKSIKDLPDLNINNNLFKTFSKDKSNLNLNKNNDFIIEEIKVGEEEEDNIINNNVGTIKKKKIEVIDSNKKTEDNKDINYTTPETKEKVIEEIYQKVQNINDERNKNSGPKEFTTLENEELRFSDFSSNFDTDKIIINKKETTYINNKSNDNFIIESNKQKVINNNDDVKKNKKQLKEGYLYYVITDKRKKIIQFFGNKNNNKIFKIPYSSYLRIIQLCLKIKPTQNKIYENFLKKLFQKMTKNFGDNSININKSIINNKIEKDIKIFENELKYLKDCYIYLIVKKNKLKLKKEKEKLINEIDSSNKMKEIEKLLDNLILHLNKEKKQNQYFYAIKIKNILNKYKKISEYEISNAKIKDSKDKLIFPKYEKLDSNEKNDLYKEKSNFSSFIILILPIIFIYIYFNIQAKK